MSKDPNNSPEKLATSQWHPYAIWHRLTRPASSVKGVARQRKSRLLASFLLIMLLGFFLLDISYYLTVPGYMTPLSDVGGYLILISAYLMNKQGHYKISAILTVYTVPFVLFTSIVTNSTQNPIVTLNFLILGLLISSILLSVRSTVIFSIIIILGTWLMPVLAPVTVPDFTTISGPLAALLIGAGLVVTAMVHRNQLENERQAALRESEERFRAIYDGVNDAIFLHDANTFAILDANKKMTEMFGYTVEEARQLQMRDPLTHRSRFSLKESLDWMETAVTQGTAFFEWYSGDKTGRRFWIEVNLRYTQIAQQDTILAVVRDITERKQNEAALLQEKQFSETLLNSLPDVFFLSSSDLKMLRWNHNLEAVTGYSSEELIGTHAFDLIAKEDNEKFTQAIQQVFTVGHGSVEARIILKNGQQIPYFLTVAQFFRHEQRFLLGTGLNLKKLKQTEEKLRIRNNELTLLNEIIAATAGNLDTKAILQIVCDGLIQRFDLTQAVGILFNHNKLSLQVVAEYRPENRPSLLGLEIPVANNPFVELMLSSRAPLIIEDIHNDPRLDSVREILQQWPSTSALAIPIIVDDEIVGGLSFGTEKPRSFSSDDLQLAHRLTEQIASAMKKIQLENEHQDLEVQIRQAQKMDAIGRLSAGVAHDFNNLLTIINLYADLLHHKMAPDSTLRTYVEKILQAGRGAADVVHQLLAFSRKQVIEPQPLNLNTLITALNKILYSFIGNDIELAIRLAPELWEIQNDKTQIEQVIINLVINARDAMPAGGNLLLETANITLDEPYIGAEATIPQGDFVQLLVKDTGHGMSKEVLERIFEPYFTTKEVGKGTGLGLATVFGIIKQGGGTIQVQSEPDAGTTFIIRLPRTLDNQISTASNEKRPINISGTETILLVEDNDDVRPLVEQLLRAKGYTVLTAPSGPEALKLASAYEEPIDLLLTDVIMPGMSGNVLAKKLSRMRPGLRVLFMSGYSGDKIARHGVLASEILLLPKPFSELALVHKVREALDRDV